jgi:hypothetical protein
VQPAATLLIMTVTPRTAHPTSAWRFFVCSGVDGYHTV